MRLNIRTFILIISVVIGVIAFQSSAFGQCDEDSYWWDVDSGDWSEPYNWIHNAWDANSGECVGLPGVPISDDAALIWNGGTATLTNAAACRWTDIGPGSGVMVEPGGALSSADGIAVWGVLRQTGGLVNTQGTLCAHAAGGSYVLSGGSVLTHNLVVGDQGIGEFLQSGGSVSTDYLIVGYEGTGTFKQTGGTVTINDDLILGDQPNSNGTYELLGGTLDVDGDRVCVGKEGRGHFTLRNGVLNVALSHDIDIGDGVDSNGFFVVDGGTINATCDECCIYVYGKRGSLTGPGTFNIRVAYGSDRIYGTHRNKDTEACFLPNCLTEGGAFSATKITPGDFAGGNIANLLPSSVFDVNFGGSFCGEYIIAIPYDESEVDALDVNETSLVILHETGPGTYKRLETFRIDDEDDVIGAWASTFGKFAVQVRCCDSRNATLHEIIFPDASCLTPPGILGEPIEADSNERLE
ncbi:MAG: hypothetical protein NTX52_13155, partial [Planctomycetota bacterium]|nr:hypothetical protein [Planctomycetota bacterium]